MQKGSQYTDLMKREIMSIKQERSELLTSLHKLKEENTSLRNELNEATNDLNVWRFVLRIIYIFI